MPDEGLETEHVASGPETRNDADREIGEERLATSRLAGEDVGEVNLDERDADGEEGVPHRDRGMGERRGVHDGAVCRLRQRLHELYQLAFMVGLAPGQLNAERRRALTDEALQIGKRLAAVELRFTRAEEIEIGTVQDGDAHLALETLEPLTEGRIAFLIPFDGV